MARTCTVCTHAQRAEIDHALVAGGAFRSVAERFGTSAAALFRHKGEHIPALLAKAQAEEQRAEQRRAVDLRGQVDRQAAEETAYALDVMAELRRCFQRINLLFDACDRWLRDADDPTRYDIGPRASEMLVTYLTIPEGADKPVTRKEPLSRLLARLEESGTTSLAVETKHADPRELVLKTADRLRAQTELLAKLMGELDERPQINVLAAPEWLSVRAALLDALLRPYPEARTAVAARLAALDASA